MNPENLRVVTDFNSTWRSAEPERIGQEILSVFNETHRQVDDFYIIIQNGTPIDPATETTIWFDKSTDLERREAEFFDQLVSEADKRDSGSFVLISPSLIGTYPCNKAILYQIAYTFEYPPQKVLTGSAILFDTPKDHTLQIAKQLDPSTANTSNAEILRNKLFICPDEFNLTDLLELIGTNYSDSTPTPSQELISHFVGLIKSGHDPRLIAQEMQARGVIGKHSISCPPSLFGISLTLDFTVGKDILKCVQCPFCKTTVDAEIFDGEIHCPNCNEKRPYQKAA